MAAPQQQAGLALSGRFGRKFQAREYVAAPLGGAKGVSRQPHFVGNCEVIPQKHKKSAFAVVLSLAVR
jgi:hypothetical protein